MMMMIRSSSYLVSIDRKFSLQTRDLLKELSQLKIFQQFIQAFPFTNRDIYMRCMIVRIR